jgi:hypothetical protein
MFFARYAAKTQALLHVFEFWFCPVLFLSAFAAVSSENAGLGKFAQFMSDHFFGDEHFVEHFSVMDEERITYELRHDGTRPCPSFDRLFFADGFLFLDLPVQFRGNERTFFD